MYRFAMSLCQFRQEGGYLGLGLVLRTTFKSSAKDFLMLFSFSFLSNLGGLNEERKKRTTTKNGASAEKKSTQLCFVASMAW